MKVDPNEDGSTDKMVEMVKNKTLVGPGYYNLNHTSNERNPPSFSFEKETSKLFDNSKYTAYLKESRQIGQRRQGRGKGLNNSSERAKPNSKERLFDELVTIVEDGGHIEREDVSLLVDRMKKEHKGQRSQKLPIKKQELAKEVVKELASPRKQIN